MPGNVVTGGGAVPVAVATAPTDTSDHIMEDEELMPIVVSDIPRPMQNHGTKPPLPPQEKPQTPISSPGKERPPIFSTAQKPPSTTRLAVHIRASPATSHLSFIKMGQAESVPPVPSQALHSRPRPPKTDNRATASSSSPSKTKDGSDLQPRKRGRPKGWKPGMRYAEPKARERRRQAEPANGQEPKRRGRPPRAPERSFRQQYLQSNPEYAPFKCEWVGLEHTSPCPAELQNMETLRKHVFFIHGDTSVLVCRWGKCATKGAPLEFTEWEGFEKHMEREHFRSYVWYMGEGYQNRGISTIEQDPDKLPSYLFDKDGNQVTPSVNQQKLEDIQQHKERRRKLRNLLIQLNENAPDEEEYIKQTLGTA